MTQLRVLKAVTVCAFLVLLTTAWEYKFSLGGYRQTLDSLQKSYGANADIFIALFSVVSLVSMPIFGSPASRAWSCPDDLAGPHLCSDFFVVY